MCKWNAKVSPINSLKKMTEAARDSGICVDNDNDSLSSVSSSTTLSYVQRLKKRFEFIAKEQEREFHAECNWWLHEEDEEQAEDTKETHEIIDVPNKTVSRNVSVESEVKSYSKQSSIKSQVSRDSSNRETLLIITPSTPVNNPPTPLKDYLPKIIFSDYQENNETNDSDSFDSDNEDEDIEDIEEGEEILEDEYNSQTIKNGSRHLRPVSISSQVSK